MQFVVYLYVGRNANVRTRATLLPAHRIYTRPRLAERTKRPRSQNATSAARPAIAIWRMPRNRNAPKMAKRLRKSRYNSAIGLLVNISCHFPRKSRKIEAVIEESTSSSSSSSSDSSNSTLPSYEVIDEKKTRRRKRSSDSSSSDSSSSSSSSSSTSS